MDCRRSLGERGGHGSDLVPQSAQARPRHSLNGIWEAVSEPYGRTRRHAGHGPRALAPDSASDLAELAVSDDWNSQDPRS